MIRLAKHIAWKLFFAGNPSRLEWLKERAFARKYAASGSPWHWRKATPSPHIRIEAAGARMGSRLYLIGGYESLEKVHNSIGVFDMDSETWLKTIDTPADMAQSHHGATTEGNRFIYIASGQLGANCSPATRTCHVLDTENETWETLPSLPEARYAPVCVFHLGRIHVVGGSDEDRFTPKAEHWSIGVRNGQATELEWKIEPPISRAGTHRGGIVHEGVLFVLGGQEGDVRPIQNESPFLPDWDTPFEMMYPDVYKYAFVTRSWSRCADLPKPRSHNEASIAVIDGRIVIFAGISHRHVVEEDIFAYDPDADGWETVGKLPTGIKGPVMGLWKNRVCIVSGQRQISIQNRWPGDLTNTVWTAEVPTAVWRSRSR